MKLKKCLLIPALFVMTTFALVGCKEHPEYDTYMVDDYELDGEMLSDEALPDEAHPTTLFIDICGAVLRPGVYELPENARLFEAVEAAGGFCDDVCLESLNQAEILSDGQKIYVMTIREWEEQKNQAGDANIQNDGRVNINTADATELCSLPGIGQTRAEAIISYREYNGKFATIEDIKNVSGIKNGTYDKISELIKVE